MTDDLPAGEPAIRGGAMPADTNPHGDIFGGWLLGLMDQAGGLVAARLCRGRVATVALDGMSFIRPVHVGDEVSVYARIAGRGRTSLRVDVSAWRRLRDGEDIAKVTAATFTFVHLGEDGRPKAIEA